MPQLPPLAEWESFWVIIGSSGGALTGLMLIGVARMRRQRQYKPVLEDWLWHAWFPLIAYAGLLIAGFLLLKNPELALYLVACVGLLLLFIGIHNAWDAAIY